MSELNNGQSKLIFPFLQGIYSLGSRFSYPLIRITIGAMLIPHGAQKLFGWFGGKGLSHTAEIFATHLGINPAMLFAVLAGLIEFFGGIFLVVGFLTRPVAAAVVCLMLVAAFHVHLDNGFFWSKGGYEYPLMWALISLAVLFEGGGKCSIDRKIGKEF